MAQSGIPIDNPASLPTPPTGPATGDESTGYFSGGGYTPPNTLPGDNYADADPGLGAAHKGGQAGSQTIVPEIEGDLGTRYMDLNSYLLLQESVRRNATVNGLQASNSRNRGHKEANKFNLAIQKAATACASMYVTLNTWNTNLQTKELNDMYPEDEEVELIYHVLEQIKFKEWLLLKDEDKRWF